MILVDDGIATGATLLAAIELCHRMRPYKIIVAAPVSPIEVALKLKPFVDEVVILELPSFRGIILVEPKPQILME